MIISFPSTVNPTTIQFAYDSDRWRTAPVHCSFVFWKMDENEIVSPVTELSTDRVGDYFISLARELAINDKLCHQMRWIFDCGPSREELNFAAKVIAKPKKTLYYSTSLKKISATRNKQYDRRYEIITEDMNGSPQSMMSILNPSSPGLVRYAYASAIHAWVNADRKRYRKYSMSLPAQVLKWTEDYEEARAIQIGWEACLRANNIYNLRQELTSDIERFTRCEMLAKLGQ